MLQCKRMIGDATFESSFANAVTKSIMTWREENDLSTEDVTMPKLLKGKR